MARTAGHRTGLDYSILNAITLRSKQSVAYVEDLRIPSRRRRGIVRKHIPSSASVYGRDVVFLYGERDALNYLLVRECDAETTLHVASRGMWIQYEHSGGHMTDYIVLIRRGGRHQQVAALAHEINHHAFAVLARAGVHVTADNDEAFCYYAQWIMTQCLEAL